MDYPKFKDLKVGDNNLEILALVTDCKVKQTVNQTPYYGLTISDGDTLADARMWTVTLVNELAEKEIDIQNKEENLEEKLEKILSRISGVGDVSVLLTYSETSSVFIPIFLSLANNSAATVDLPLQGPPIKLITNVSFIKFYIYFSNIEL